MKYDLDQYLAGGSRRDRPMLGYRTTGAWNWLQWVVLAGLMTGLTIWVCWGKPPWLR